MPRIAVTRDGLGRCWCIVIEGARREIKLFWGPQLHAGQLRQEIGFAYWRDRGGNPLRTADRWGTLSWSWRLLRLRWAHQPDATSDWTGRAWKLSGWTWDLPQIRIA